MIKKGGTALIVQEKQKQTNKKTIVDHFLDKYSHKLDWKTNRTAQAAVHSQSATPPTTQIKLT